MNSKMLLDALGDISDEYVMGAQKYLTNDVLKITNSKAHQRTVPQKLLILAATIAAVMSLLVTAMAVNEDFREKVFEFFHISTSENVPNGGNLATSGLDTVIGERVSARYGYECHPAAAARIPAGEGPCSFPLFPGRSLSSARRQPSAIPSGTAPRP